MFFVSPLFCSICILYICFMPKAYRFYKPDGIYFVTFTVVDWVDVFTRSSYKEIFVDSLNCAINNKGLIVYSWVVMSNHVHLIISSQENNELLAIVRDLKKFTAKKIINEIVTNFSTVT